LESLARRRDLRVPCAQTAVCFDSKISVFQNDDFDDGGHRADRDAAQTGSASSRTARAMTKPISRHRMDSAASTYASSMIGAVLAKTPRTVFQIGVGVRGKRRS
jgi:hypothetical protein